ncbi:MAG: peptide deformylase [Acidobacteria bacterium]|nr:peptide deformylase [Acidobacteriota bacterium]
MAILKVARLGHPVLREKAADVEPEDIRKGRFEQLIDDMFETMDDYQGVGLAAPQIHIPLRIFVFAVDEAIARRKRVPPLEAGVFFNATYEPAGENRITDWEGCLSVPLLGGEVPRWESIILRGLDINGRPAEVRVKGYPARIFQHEVDHTDGNVYLDRMPDLTTLGYTTTL